MRRFLSVFVLACALSSCGHKMSPAERKAADEKAIAEVKANQAPPPDTPEVQPISSQEIDALGLTGGGCTIYGKSDSGAVLALIYPDTAYMKLDGDVDRFISDNGSKPGPMDTRAHYDGKRRSLDVDVGTKGKSLVSDTLDYPATLTLRDGKGRVEAALAAMARCGG